MKFNPQHILTLGYVAQTKNLSTAAKIMGITQPAITSQLKILSNMIGENVVKRNRHGVTLSPAAKELIPESNDIIRSINKIEEKVSKLNSFEEGVIRVFCTSSILCYLIPQVLSQFYNDFPKITVDLNRIDNAKSAIEKILKNKADIILYRGSSEFTQLMLPKNIILEKLLDNQILLAVSPKHELSKFKKIDFKNLHNLEIIKFKGLSGTQILVNEYAKNLGVNLITKHELPGVEAVKEAILNNLGAAFISKLPIKRQLFNKNILGIDLIGSNLQRPVMLAYHKDDKKNHKIINFLDKIKNVIKQF